MPTTSGVDLSISGLATGFDWKSVVTQLANAERSPELLWHRSQAKIANKNATFDRIKTFLSALQTDVKALKDPALFASRTATASDATIASATAATATTAGTYAFDIKQLATAASINGTGNAGQSLTPTSDLSTLTVADANFATAVTAGNLTINGKQIALATTDTLQQVFGKIATATANNVTGTYDPTTDKFTLTSANSSEIVLGSSADTSNFFQVAQLYNNHTAAITSGSALGHVSIANTIYNSAPQLAAPVASGFAAPVTAGTFTVNGKPVTITAGDSLQTVFSSIAAATGNTVTASYNAATDKISLTSNDPAQPLVLGNAGDTSTFLQAANLANNGSGAVISSSAVGGTKAFTPHTGLNTLITGDGSSVEQLGSLAASGFSTAITAGTFTLNGKQVTLGANDTLQTVFNSIAAATSNAVTASYDAATDKISLTSTDSSKPITLGGVGDTTNFLTAAQLTANTTGSVTSAARLGGVHAQGAFSINGVIVNYNAGTDSLQNILARINNSTAGVSASYDSQNDRFVLANKVSGDVGMALQDVNGNFLAATGLSGGALTHGQNLLYTLNGGAQQLVSTSNTITQDSSSITGLTVNALTKGTVSVTVGSDTTAIKTAIQTFIKDYNTVQSYIGTQTASSTDSTGKVTAGILAADPDANSIVTNLRKLAFTPVNALPGGINQLASLGISTNGKDNTITLSDASALDNVLANNLNQVQSLFADSTSGLASQLDKFFTNTVGDSGTLTNHMASLTTQSTSIDKQIAGLEKTVAAESAQWTKSFQAMETAQAHITQQLNYLTQSINKGSL